MGSRASLDLAAFLDSEQARALDGLAEGRARKLAALFLELCYDVLGKAPRFLEGEELEQLLAELLPTRIAPDDPLGDDVEAVLTTFLDYLERNEVVTQVYELRSGLARGLAAFEEAWRSGRFRDSQVRRKTDPFVHGAEKLGRNDPCSCGSGKKYKKCHGKNA